MKKDRRLPKEIIVHWEGEPGEQFLNANVTNRGLEDGQQVGVYKLFEIKRQVVTEELK